MVRLGWELGSGGSFDKGKWEGGVRIIRVRDGGFGVKMPIVPLIRIGWLVRFSSLFFPFSLPFPRESPPGGPVSIWRYEVSK